MFVATTTVMSNITWTGGIENEENLIRGLNGPGLSYPPGHWTERVKLWTKYTTGRHIDRCYVILLYLPKTSLQTPIVLVQ